MISPKSPIGTSWLTSSFESDSRMENTPMDMLSCCVKSDAEKTKQARHHCYSLPWVAVDGLSATIWLLIDFSFPAFFHTANSDWGKQEWSMCSHSKWKINYTRRFFFVCSADYQHVLPHRAVVFRVRSSQNPFRCFNFPSIKTFLISVFRFPLPRDVNYMTPRKSLNSFGCLLSSFDGAERVGVGN